MFSRDSGAYRPSPRRLDQSKFGPYAKLSVARSQGFADALFGVASTLCVIAMVALLCYRG